MTLIVDVLSLRDRTISDLDAAHDYGTDTKLAWLIVKRLIDTSGLTFTRRNRVTGTRTMSTDLAGKARGYVADQLARATFQQFLSIFEAFLFDFLRLWLQSDPRSLSGKSLDFKLVLESPDRAAIVEAVVAKELLSLLYEKPVDWFRFLEEKAKLGFPTPAEIGRIVEAKATRDVLVHNQGIANRLYVAKAGTLARFQDGERVDLPESYHKESWVLLRKVVVDISDAAIRKLS